jgi:hypothetical protein
VCASVTRRTSGVVYTNRRTSVGQVRGNISKVRGCCSCHTHPFFVCFVGGIYRSLRHRSVPSSSWAASGNVAACICWIWEVGGGFRAVCSHSHPGTITEWSMVLRGGRDSGSCWRAKGKKAERHIIALSFGSCLLSPFFPHLPHLISSCLSASVMTLRTT